MNLIQLLEQEEIARMGKKIPVFAPGDTVVVPSKVDRESGYNAIMRGLRDWTQIFSNLGIGAAAIRTLRN